MFHFFLAIVFPVAFGASGLYDLWTGYWAFVAARQSERWPFVCGKVQSAQIVEGMAGDPGVRPSIVYEYTVADEKFTGKVIIFGMQDNQYAAGWFEYARKYVDRYPAGSRVRVYYDPGFPASAVLEPGLSWWTFAPTLWGIGTLAAVCALVVFI